LTVVFLSFLAQMGGMMMPGQPQMMPGMQMPMAMPVTSMAMPVNTMGMTNNAMGMPGAAMGMPGAAMGMPGTVMGMPATTMGMPVNSMGMGGMGMQPQMAGMGQVGGMQGQPMMAPQQPMMAVQPTVPMSVASAISSGHQSGASTPGSIQADWAIPQQARVRYGQQFQATDRNRTGFLAGVQVGRHRHRDCIPSDLIPKSPLVFTCYLLAGVRLALYQVSISWNLIVGIEFRGFSS
jgi:hypothetical protein